MKLIAAQTVEKNYTCIYNMLLIINYSQQLIIFYKYTKHNSDCYSENVSNVTNLIWSGAHLTFSETAVGTVNYDSKCIY
jgi:hypothetical protein